MIVPFPMLIPDTRYVDRWHDSGSSSAVRDLQRSQDSNHRELLAAIKQNKLAVTVVACDILPLATAAFNYLDGPCRDYDAASSRWYARYSRVRDYLKARKKRPEEAKKKAKIDAYRAKNLPKAEQKDASEHQRKNSSFFRGLPYHEAFQLVKDRKIPTPHVDEVMAWEPKEEFNYFASMVELHSMDMDWRMLEFRSSHPKKPDGYSSLQSIREVYEAAQTAPNAMLTIPADTVRAIGKFADLSGNVVTPTCHSCGSKNFLRIDGVRICSYCRTEVSP